jgi:hypothetical protein
MKIKYAKLFDFETSLIEESDRRRNNELIDFKKILKHQD